jgi:hypothetical protein
MRTTPAKVRLGLDDATLDRTIAAFQPYSPTPLTREDAREIYRNTMSVMQTLLEIRRDRDARRAAAAAAEAGVVAPDPKEVPRV